MQPHTLRTRPRRERLAARAASGSLATALALAVVLFLVHPVAPVATVAVLLAHRLDHAPARRSPTGHGRVHTPPPRPGRA